MTPKEEYHETLDWLFTQLPAFHQKGPGAYKPGFERINLLDEAFEHPHRAYHIIHIAGTNGKGSTAHSIAAMLQSAGFKTGLFTSPHLITFRERIRVDGEMISPEEVVDFIKTFRSMTWPADFEPSFFELTTMMAFDHFKRHAVDFAVVECGLGGRLDSTNIITPGLTLITSISKDHTAQLGDTLTAIAAEKAGIIKGGITTIVSDNPSSEVREVFVEKAEAVGANLIFAADRRLFSSAEHTDETITYRNTPFGDVVSDLPGDYQPGNMTGILQAALQLGLRHDAVKKGLADVCGLTGLSGRWSIVGHDPLTVYDTGHNIGGWEKLARQIGRSVEGVKRLVLGFVADKDLTHIFDCLKTIDNLRLYLTQPSNERALNVDRLAEQAVAHGFDVTTYPTPIEAYNAAKADSRTVDLVFVGGSNFVVGDWLKAIHPELTD